MVTPHMVSYKEKAHEEMRVENNKHATHRNTIHSN